METAKVSEIFVSYQGEGPFAGSRQLFVRFYGCNKSCAYCDTLLENYKSFTKNSLISKVMEITEEYNEVSLTGGEPLLYADFIREFLLLFSRYRKNQIYLETNGTLPEELKKIINQIDIIAMDFKLPSSGDDTKDDVWEAHREFYKIAVAKNLIVKAVITGSTVMDDIKKMADIIASHAKKPSIVLQPVTPIVGRVKESDEEMMFYFKKYIEKATRTEVMVLGQLHKCLGIR